LVDRAPAADFVRRPLAAQTPRKAGQTRQSADDPRQARYAESQALDQTGRFLASLNEPLPSCPALDGRATPIGRCPEVGTIPAKHPAQFSRAGLQLCDRTLSGRSRFCRQSQHMIDAHRSIANFDCDGNNRAEDSVGGQQLSTEGVPCPLHFLGHAPLFRGAQ
jgi:hypothetical protein